VGVIVCGKLISDSDGIIVASVDEGCLVGEIVGESSVGISEEGDGDWVGKIVGWKFEISVGAVDEINCGNFEWLWDNSEVGIEDSISALGCNKEGKTVTAAIG